ncbi:hypothetical protein [Streptomyces qinglanensis]|uniref:Uncharacterized protein n=1 Tax=Streptomyces qinglanensis TaxID=943816 RepID=A0A1H9UCN7_9ACTN|nr:hypothetical protein [Streptomyces qinglanensis]SES07225.1 hypothetical protein SAMN05421870_10869 [Streptomyces qinglanensis]
MSTHESDTFTLGLQVRADDGHETCLAIRSTGSVPPNLTVLILRNVRGCEAEGRRPEYALPERDLLPAEQAWSSLMDPRAAAQVLGEERWPGICQLEPQPDIGGCIHDRAQSRRLAYE